MLNREEVIAWKMLGMKSRETHKLFKILLAMVENILESAWEHFWLQDQTLTKIQVMLY
jgi:hypothetical protein